jgi:hypothetical protein
MYIYIYIYIILYDMWTSASTIAEKPSIGKESGSLPFVFSSIPMHTHTYKQTYIWHVDKCMHACTISGKPSRGNECESLPVIRSHRFPELSSVSGIKRIDSKHRSWKRSMTPSRRPCGPEDPGLWLWRVCVRVNVCICTCRHICLETWLLCFICKLTHV